MTYPPGQPGGQPFQSYPQGPQQPYPPQPGYAPQPGYPQPYPGQQARPGAGTTIAASILMSITSLRIIVASVLQPVFAHLGELPLRFVIQDVVSVLADLVVILATILLWARQPVGRVLAIIGLAVVVALDVYNVIMLHGIVARILTVALNVAALVLVGLPATGAYLKSRRTPPNPQVAPGYPPRQWQRHVGFRP